MEKRVSSRFSKLFAVFAFAVLTGCATVGPDYEAPKTPISSTWNSALEGGLTEKEMGPSKLAAWWTALGDPELSSLMSRAVGGDLGIKEAQARVREARARRGISRADLFPTLDATGNASWSRSSEETGTGKSRDLYAAGFDAGWEIDLFGGVRRTVEAAEANLQASEEDLRDVLVSLTAEIALNYVEARTFQTRLSVAEKNLVAQEETYRLNQARYQAGLSDELTVQQARYNLENTRSQMPTLRTGLEETKNRLAVLLGEQPGAVHAELAECKPLPVIPVEVAVGMPADLLHRRPDIRRAERELAAQTAKIGVAMSDLYPKLNLSGSIGIEALSPGDLFPAGSRTLGIGPRINWPVFNAGAVRRNIDVQTALQEEALVQYESVILGALEEVENALVSYAEEQRRKRTLGEATLAAEQAVTLAQDKYHAGLIDFSEVLDAQRSLLSFQDQMAQSEGEIVANLVRLYKALGGGWAPMRTEEK